MVAESFNGSITVSSLCRTRPFVQYKSVSTWGRMPLMLTMDCSIQDYKKIQYLFNLKTETGKICRIQLNRNQIFFICRLYGSQSCL